MLAVEQAKRSKQLCIFFFFLNLPKQVIWCFGSEKLPFLLCLQMKSMPNVICGVFGTKTNLFWTQSVKTSKNCAKLNSSAQKFSFWSLTCVVTCSLGQHLVLIGRGMCALQHRARVSARRLRCFGDDATTCAVTGGSTSQAEVCRKATTMNPPFLSPSLQLFVVNLQPHLLSCAPIQHRSSCVGEHC